jgi:hypothetical protein
MRSSSVERPYDTDSGPKQECRERFVSAIRNHIDTSMPHIFLLPSKLALDANLLRREFPKCSLFGVENDPKTFEMVDTSMGLVLDQCSVHAYVTQKAKVLKPRHFDAAFLDFEGFASFGNVADVCEFVANDQLIWPGRKTVLAATFGKYPRGETGMVETLVRRKSWLNEDQERREKGQPWNTHRDVACMLAGHLNSGINEQSREVPALRSRLRVLRLLEDREYKANPDSTPMYFLIFLIEKYLKGEKR